MGLWYKSRVPFSSLFRSAVRTHDSAGRERSIVDFSSTLARRFINKIAPKEMHQRRTNRRRVINIAAVSNQATRDMKPWKIDTSKQIYNEWFANRRVSGLPFFFSLPLPHLFAYSGRNGCCCRGWTRRCVDTDRKKKMLSFASGRSSGWAIYFLFKIFRTIGTERMSFHLLCVTFDRIDACVCH